MAATNVSTMPRLRRMPSTNGIPLEALARTININLGEAANTGGVTFASRQLRANQSLFHAGDQFESLHFVHSGHFKSSFQSRCGATQVLAFPMRGEFLGADGIACGTHQSSAVALDTAEVIVIPYSQLIALCRQHASLEKFIYRLLGGEIQCQQRLLSLIGTMSAMARVAHFLLDLGARNSAMGYSGRQFTLKMTRADMGLHLGLTFETVSRCLSALQACRIAVVERREIQIIDQAGLSALAQGSAGSLPCVEMPARIFRHSGDPQPASVSYMAG